ncbi:MAG TPA: hypothetical protein PKH94_00805 [Bacteroidales bacterium]|nr:hypothetical protein [Bacteroidales bacterium]HNS45755.1 hypothetical protein [Bacteroidales bacterium]
MKNATLPLLMIIISTSCWGQRKEYSYTNVTFHQIEFSEITFLIKEQEQDTLQIKGILKENRIIDDIPCYGEVTFTTGWNLSKCILAVDHIFAGNTFPKDTHLEIGLDLDLQKDIRSLKYYCAIRGARIQFINRCVSSSDLLINGISCNGSEGIFFKTDWSLLGCILAEEDTIARNILPGKTFVRFDHNGTICCFSLTNPIIQGLTCSGSDYTHWLWSGGGGVFLYPSGQLKYFQPLDDTEIQGTVCKRSQVRGGVHFYEDGSLKKCTSAIDQTIDGIFCEKNATLKFDENGTLTYAVKEKIFD